jgi:hypothetical protein
MSENMQYLTFWAWLILLMMISIFTHFTENDMISFFFIAD